MRFVRIIVGAVVAAFVVVAGLIATGLVTLFLAIRRALNPVRRAEVMPPSRRRASSADVIDITATEVPVDSSGR